MMPRPTAAARRFVLPIGAIRPVVRIAHRLPLRSDIARRIILDFELVLVTAGAWTWASDAQTLALRGGDLLLIEPFVPHAFSGASRDAEHIAVHLDLSPDVPGGKRDKPYAVALSHGRSLPRLTKLPRGGPAWSTLERIVERFNQADVAAGLEADCLAGAVIARLLDKTDATAHDPHRAKLAKLLAYVDANLHAPLAAEDLAAAADLSPSRLRAVFAEAMGTSPKQFILQRRVALARRLLAEPSMAIKEVAIKTGFADAFHFSKAFRRIDGLPPSVYRRQVLGR